MITQEQYKQLSERTQQLAHYLNIDAKRIELEEEQLRTQAPDFWDDAKAAEAQMKKVKTIQFWLTHYDELQSLVGEVELSLEFYRDQMVSEQ